MTSCGGSHLPLVTSSHRGGPWAAQTPQKAAWCCAGAQTHQEPETGVSSLRRGHGQLLSIQYPSSTCRPRGLSITLRAPGPGFPIEGTACPPASCPRFSLARSELPQEPQPVTSRARREGTPGGTCPAMLELLGSCQLGKISKGCSETLPSFNTQHTVKCTDPK